MQSRKRKDIDDDSQGTAAHHQKSRTIALQQTQATRPSKWQHCLFFQCINAKVMPSTRPLPTGTFPWDPKVAPPLIIGIGMNYASHAKELGKPLPSKPVVFSKGPNTITGSGSPIVIPAEEPNIDFEGELAVIIGARPCRDVSVEEALSYVGGYCVANDVSGRTWQFEHFNGGQWVRSKSFDTFTPLGPQTVDAATVGDPQQLQITTKLNGEIVQDSSTSDMVFSVAEIVAFLSTGATLLPNTVILTGTPSGVGHSRKPPRYLRSGDTVAVSISKVGELANKVVHASEFAKSAGL